MTTVQDVVAEIEDTCSSQLVHVVSGVVALLEPGEELIFRGGLEPLRQRVARLGVLNRILGRHYRCLS